MVPAVTPRCPTQCHDVQKQAVRTVVAARIQKSDAHMMVSIRLSVAGDAKVQPDCNT
jgi:hypothetical protein